MLQSITQKAEIGGIGVARKKGGETSIYDNARRLMEEALTELLKENGRATGPQIRTWLQKNRHEKFGEISPSFSSWLTKASQDPDSKIERITGQQGYRLKKDLSFEPPVPPNENSDTAEKQAYTKREQKLYGMLADWLRAEDYRAKVISEEKKGGPWGNPDVAGLRLAEAIEGLGSVEAELVTIEVKLTHKDWQRAFFEAVSHTRFSNRVYFAFPYPAEEDETPKPKEFRDMRVYGEKFGVGIIAILLTKSQYEQLTRDKIESLTFKLDETRQMEIWPALSNVVMASEQRRFIREVLKIRKAADAYTFGG